MIGADLRISMLEQQIASLTRQVERLSRRAGSPFALARSTMNPNDDGSLQTVQAQLDALSERDGIPILYHYGFFSSPPIGADLHVAFLDGDRSQAVAIATGHQSFRFKGAAVGDVGMNAFGNIIHLNSGGIAIAGNIQHAGNYTLTGDLHVTGAVIAGYGGGDQVGLQTHKHPGSGSPPIPGT